MIENIRQEELNFEIEGQMITATAATPDRAEGLVIFAHGSGSSRHSPRNRAVANYLNESGLATILCDLLTMEEQYADEQTGHLRFDIHFLAGRLTNFIEGARQLSLYRHLPIGLFGASTGAAAAILTAVEMNQRIKALVSRGGRPDLAGAALSRLKAPSLLIVGGLDLEVIKLNQEAMRLMTGKKRLEIVHGASHLFEEPDKMGLVSRLAADWFEQYLVEIVPEERSQRGGRSPFSNL